MLDSLEQTANEWQSGERKLHHSWWNR